MKNIIVIIKNNIARGGEYMSKRLSYIDITRAFAIIFIVLGHTINHSQHCSITFKIIYSFHVVYSDF